jgi:predicted TIM-barrel fold metal-dependent hydrolase
MTCSWPQGCDTHVHVFDPGRFAYAPDRRYTPGAATVGALREHLARLGLDRAVIVAASAYGTDNRCLVGALEDLGPARARGVAVLSEAASIAEIDALDRAGVRGARLNLEVGRERDPKIAGARLRALARQIPSHWRICLYGSLPLIVALRDVIAALPRPAVIEHFGMARVADGGVTAPGFDDLLALLHETGSFIKFSGPYQISGSKPGYADAAPVARALAAAAPGRVLWGSNWPHTAGAARTAKVDVGRVEPFRQEDDAGNLRLLAEWLGEKEARSALVDAPRAAFDFDA